jgi:glutathione S-transferase
MIRLLGRATSGNVQKVIFLLEEMGVKYAREDYGRQFNNTQTPEYKKLNPNSKVPTLVDGDTVIWESNSILRYLAATHQPALAGSTPAEKSHVERWMDWLLASINTPYLAMFRDAKKEPAERAPDFPAQNADLVAQLKILDGHLAGKSYLALDRLTIADIALAAIVKRCIEFPVDKPDLPEVKRWLKSVEARPAFAVAVGAKPSALNTAA